MEQVLSEIAVLFTMMFFGVIAGKKNLIDEQMASKLSTLVLSGTFPALIISSMDRPFDKTIMSNAVELLLATVILAAITIVAIELEVKLRKQAPQGMSARHFATLFGNTSFMGIPILSALYGDEGIFYAAVINIVFNALIFSYGIYLFSRSKEVRLIGVLFNAGFIATLIGIVLFVTPLKLPYVLSRSLQWCGNMTIPLALLLAGSIISRHKISQLLRPISVWGASAIRVVLFPLLLIPIMSMMHLKPMTISILAVIFSTPAPLTGTSFAEKYGGDAFYMSKIVVLSNLMSIVTLPIVVFVLNFVN